MNLIQITPHDLDLLTHGKTITVCICPKVQMALVDKNGKTADEVLATSLPDSN